MERTSLGQYTVYSSKMVPNDSSQTLLTEACPLTRDKFAMQCVQMIKEEGLISEVSTLLKDTNLSLVKRTIRVFANVYRYSLQLLSTDDLDETTFSKAWPAVNSISNEIVEMLKNSENEGVIIHIVRFLEASVLAEILSDISRYPHIASKMEERINVGIKSLKDILTLPYGEGSSFLVGVRSIITIACYKNNVRKEVIDLIEKLMAKPPPTLFDHHVRCFHKVLRKHLFRLLKREEVPEEREWLIVMMGNVGVPRHMLSQWSPQSSDKKRLASESNSDESHKKRKFANKSTQSPPLPDHPLQSQPLDSLISSPNLPVSTSALTPGIPPALLPGSPPHSASSQRSQEIPHSAFISDIPNLSWKDSGSSQLDKLKVIFGNLKSKKTSKEEIICEGLENPDVVELEITCIAEVSDAYNEQELIDKLTKAGDENVMREALSEMLVKLLPKSIIDAIHCNEISSVNQIKSPDLKCIDSSVKQTDPRLRTNGEKKDTDKSVKPVDPRLKIRAEIKDIDNFGKFI